MGYQHGTTVQTQQAKGARNQEVVAFDAAPRFSPMLMKDDPLLGLVPDPLSDLYWRDSSNEARKHTLVEMQEKAKQAGEPDPVTQGEVHPSVAYVDLTDASTDWSELILGAPNPDLTDEERAEQEKQILEDLKAHVAHIVDDGVKYTAPDAEGEEASQDRDPTLFKEPVDTVLGDEIHEIDGQMNEDQLRERLTGHYDLPEEDLQGMDTENLQMLLRSKVLMDFALSESEGVDVAQLQEAFASGTVLVNIPSGSVTGPIDSGKALDYVSDKYLMSGQVEGTALEPVAALQFAQLALESCESPADREVMQGHHQEYVESEHAQMRAGGVSNIFDHGLPTNRLPQFEKGSKPR